MRIFASARLALAVVSLLGAGVAAEAATLATAGLRIGAANDFSCVFTNTSNRDVHVVIDMFELDGHLVGQASPILEPNETYHFKNQSPSSEAMHCRFEFTGNSKYARALACLGTASAGCTAVAPAQ